MNKNQSQILSGIPEKMRKRRKTKLLLYDIKELLQNKFTKFHQINRSFWIS